MKLKTERQAVVDAARRMTETGLVVNTSGNVSLLAGDTVVITPSSIAYETMRAEEDYLVELATGEAHPGMLYPSSDVPLHLAVYRARRAQAIVHTHSMYATALTTVGARLPAIHYQIVDLGGVVPVPPFATFPNRELAGSVSPRPESPHPRLIKDPRATTNIPGPP